MSSSRPREVVEGPTTTRSRFDTRNRRYYQFRDKLILHQLKVIKVANMIERPPWLWQPSMSREDVPFTASAAYAAKMLQNSSQSREERRRSMKQGNNTVKDGIKRNSSYFIPGITGRARCLQECSPGHDAVDELRLHGNGSTEPVVGDSRLTQLTSNTQASGLVSPSPWDVQQESPGFWRADVSYQGEGYDAHDICPSLLSSIDLARQLHDASKLDDHSANSSVDDSLIEKRLQYVQLKESPDRDDHSWNRIMPKQELPLSEELAPTVGQMKSIARHQSTEISPKRPPSRSVFTVPKILFQKDKSGVSNRSVNTTWTVGTTISGTTSHSDSTSLQPWRMGSIKSTAMNVSGEEQVHNATLCDMVSMATFKNSE